MTPAQRRRLLAHAPLERYTPEHAHRPRPARARARSACSATATRIDDEEFLPGLLCLAVLVPGRTGRSNLCVAVQAPMMRARRPKAMTAAAGAAARGPGARRDRRRRRGGRHCAADVEGTRLMATATGRAARPTACVAVRDVFGIDSDLRVPAFAERDEHVPEIDPAYRFNRDVTLALLAGFARNRRVLVQGLHGTGKSTHIEQVAARLNWPCVRVNLDGHISRLDLVGKRRGGAARRPAGHRVPGRHPALGAAAAGGAGLRRVRRRPARRDVRDPARARARRQAHADGPEPRAARRIRASASSPPRTPSASAT